MTSPDTKPAKADARSVMTEPAFTVRLLNLAEVRAKVRLSTPTIYRWMKAGTFPAQVKLSESCVRWREADLDAWIESRANL